MNEADLTELVTAIRDGSVAPDDAVRRLRRLPFAEVGEAKIDHHRTLRQGVPEAIYGPGKSPKQCVEIVGELLENGSGPVLLTRANVEQADAVIAVHGAPQRLGGCLLFRAPTQQRTNQVVVVTAGTADTPVADEAAITLNAYGFTPHVIHDVGVAGLHRLLANLDEITSADAVIVIAGMEGALASVVGGFTSCPVVAVPTSVGYGSGLEGVTALLGMLASCSSGLTVVGIDNGFGAASAVARMIGSTS